MPHTPKLVCLLAHAASLGPRPLSATFRKLGPELLVKPLQTRNGYIVLLAQFRVRHFSSPFRIFDLLSHSRLELLLRFLFLTKLSLTLRDIRNHISKAHKLFFLTLARNAFDDLLEVLNIERELKGRLVDNAVLDFGIARSLNDLPAPTLFLTFG